MKNKKVWSGIYIGKSSNNNKKKKQSSCYKGQAASQSVNGFDWLWYVVVYTTMDTDHEPQRDIEWCSWSWFVATQTMDASVISIPDGLNYNDILFVLLLIWITLFRPLIAL